MHRIARQLAVISADKSFEVAEQAVGVGEKDVHGEDALRRENAQDPRLVRRVDRRRYRAGEPLFAAPTRLCDSPHIRALLDVMLDARRLPRWAVPQTHEERGRGMRLHELPRLEGDGRVGYGLVLVPQTRTRRVRGLLARVRVRVMYVVRRIESHRQLHAMYPTRPSRAGSQVDDEVLRALRPGVRVINALLPARRELSIVAKHSPARLHHVLRIEEAAHGVQQVVQGGHKIAHGTRLQKRCRLHRRASSMVQVAP